MQRQHQQLMRRDMDPKDRPTQPQNNVRKVPVAAKRVTKGPDPLVVELRDENFAKLLMHDDTSLLAERKKEDGPANYAELLKGNLPGQKKDALPAKEIVTLPDQNMETLLEQKKRTAQALAAKRAKRLEQIRRNPRWEALADRTLTIVDSIFKPTKQIKLSEDEDPYFGKEGQVKVDYSVLQAAPIIKFSLLVFFVAVGFVLYLGWRVRGEELLTAESGLGYKLGIIGGSMMLVLVFYPMRKKFAFMKFIGPIRFWFYLHMIFGTLGPALILFHANFTANSLNGLVALTFTLLVAASGFFHIFIHAKIHYLLHGRKMSLQELQDKTEVNRSSIQHIFDYAPKLKQRLLDFEDQVLTPPHSVLQSVMRVMTIGFKTRLNYLIITRGLKRGLKVVFERAGWPQSEMDWQHKTNKKLIRKHMKAILEIVELSFYERLFAQWYLFHGPLFYMLILVALMHVVAVHMY